MSAVEAAVEAEALAAACRELGSQMQPRGNNAVAAATAVVDTDYVCCVDTVTAGGEVYTEMVWRFTVRGKNCCAQSPCTHRRVQA